MSFTSKLDQYVNFSSMKYIAYRKAYTNSIAKLIVNIFIIALVLYSIFGKLKYHISSQYQPNSEDN